MNTSIKCICTLFFISSLLSNRKLCSANDTINTTSSVRDNETLVSSGGSFELGFFSPGNSKNWYLGIWYKNISVPTVAWVANREIPLKNRSSGILKVMQPGQLVLLNDANIIIWSSNASTAAQNPVVQLLDSGNLVLRDVNDDDPENYLWQSFDYPTDTMLVGMNFGWNNRTGMGSYLSSWKTDEDPAPGNFTFHLDPTGYPQTIIKSGEKTVHRNGPWNGLVFSGTPDFRNDPIVAFSLHMEKNNVYYRGDAKNESYISRFTLNPSGVGQRSVWVDQNRDWAFYLSIPADYCDYYNWCGAYGSCNIGNYPPCGCLDKFEPKDQQGWIAGIWTNGCVRKTALNCTAGDIFLTYSNIKLPDARTSWYNESMTLEECKVECLKNCSCTAYTNLDISKGGSGCILWFGDLLDIRVLSTGGQDLYIRMAASEGQDVYIRPESNGKGKDKRKGRLALSLTIVGMVLLGLSLLLYIWKRKKNSKNGRKSGRQDKTNNEGFELPLFDLSTISKATDNFSLRNKVGEGGYGPVYKGTLEGGQDIAVKRLSKTSKQGPDEFKNEVLCIAKLQHRNLVKLIGCCVQGEEKMLIYEYMPNISLDLILFDEKNRMSLDWSKRFHIVNGIARGLMYLHQDSRLRIIHRDLKASNILLDKEMNPKISDFGIAKIFGGNETGDKTSQVVGTYGYIAPEYAVHGQFSVKSDVFSFGVIVLEIVSGKRNNAFSYGDCHLSLLGHAWTLYKEGRSIELVDTYLQNVDNIGQVVKLIHIGLLCVQQRADERPNMASVVSMLSNDGVLPQANHPGFFTEGNIFTISSANQSSCTNEITITMPQGR